MIRRFFSILEAPTTSPTKSPIQRGLSIGASSGAPHHLAAMRKATATAKSKSNSKAFDSRQDAPFAAMPRPLGRDKALAARAALLPGISPAPRRASRLGTPFGGASRAMPACPAQSAGLALDGPPQTFSLPVGSESVCPRLRARLRRGCPSAKVIRSGSGALPPARKSGRGRPYPGWGRDFSAAPPNPPPEAGEELRAGRPAPGQPVPNGTRLVGRAKRWSAIIFTFCFSGDFRCTKSRGQFVFFLAR